LVERNSFVRLFLLIVSVSLATVLCAADKKNILLIAGSPSHGPGEHEHNAGIQLLAAGLKQAVPDLVKISFSLNGEWPSDEKIAAADTIVIYSDGGKAIREIDLAKAEGTVVKWDGKDQEGKSLPSGKYTFRVQGVDKAGQSQELGTELSGRVTGVEMEGRDPVLVVETGSGKTRLELTRVSQVSADSDKAPEKTAKPGSPITAPSSPTAQSVTSQKPAAAAPNESADNKDSAEEVPSLSQLDRGVWGGMPGVNGMEGMR
jgi:hypothetical protein